MGFIQGTDAVMQFYKNDFIPFVCSTKIGIEIESELIPVRTKNDGHNKKFRQKNIGYKVTLSGILKFDEDNWTGWDFLDAQLGFVPVDFRCTFTDDEGNVRSIQGQVVIETSSLDINPADVVKHDFSLQGNGALMIFDGTVPCPSSIDSVTITGQTSVDGIIHVNYTYSGPLAQVKYRIDNMGVWAYADAGTIIDIPGLAIGDHTLNLIPVCVNGFEGDEVDTNFSITLTLSCTLGVTSIVPTVTGSSVSFVINFNALPGAGAYIKYRINDGSGFGAFVNVTGPLANPMTKVISGFVNGNYTIEIVPVCSNGVSGTGATQAFSVVASSTISVINWDVSIFPPNSLLSIYKNGALMVNQNTSGSGSFSANAGDTIRSVLSTSGTFPRDGSLTTTDNTTATTLDSRNYLTDSLHTFGTVEFTFHPGGGDTYTVHAAVSP